MKATVVAKKLRQKFKEKYNLSISDISIRSERSCVTICLKSITLNIKEIERIASSFEVVHRCEVTHEILSGGNLFVNVRFDYDTLENFYETHQAPLLDIIENTKEDLENSFQYLNVSCYINDNGSYEVLDKPGLVARSERELLRYIVYAISENTPLLPVDNQNEESEEIKPFIVDYSERSFAVFGDTFPIRKKLKDVGGGKYNRFLTYKGEKTKGWIFSNKKREAVEQLINA